MIFLLACLTMAIDHIGYLWHSSLVSIGIGSDIFRAIGRLAFPLFCWGIVRGYRLTRDRWKYASRLLALACISQIPFVFSFYSGNILEGWNVCFTLLAGLCVIAIWEENNFLPEIRKKKTRRKVEFLVKIFGIAFIAFLSGEAYGLHFDYGTYGVLTIFLLHIFWQQKWHTLTSFAILTGIFYYTDVPLLWTYISQGDWTHLSNVFWLLPRKVEQWWSIFSIVLLYFLPLQKYDFRFPVWFRYGFYPGHMAILFLLSRIIP